MRTEAREQKPENSVAIGIDGGEVGFALRAEPSHSGDKGDGGVNTTLVMEKVPSSKFQVPNVTHALKAEGADASEDGTGRGVPIIPENIERRTSNAEHRSEEELPEVVGALSDGAHMGGGLTARTHTPDESLRCVAPAVRSTCGVEQMEQGERRSGGGRVPEPGFGERGFL